MLNPTSPINLNQYCLDKLQQVLDLALHTAEVASAEANHRLVLQAVREVTRIITLINKMSATGDRESTGPFIPAAMWLDTDTPVSSNSVTSGKNAPDIPSHTPDLKNSQRKSDSGSQPPKTRNSGRNISSAPTSLLEAHYPELENLLEKWEISGKIPGNDPIVTNMVKNYQKLNQLEKNACNSPKGRP